MTVFERLDGGYEQIVFGHDAQTGLRTIISIFSTARGPALGGTRIFPYAHENDALVDVLRLSKAMAYKAACADLPLGGGKAVILADPATQKTPDLLRAYGRVVDRLGGAYITTADVGSTVPDLDVIAETTRHITGTSRGSGDPSPVTAHGVWHGLRAVGEVAFGEPSMDGRHVVVQGVGKVGSHLVRKLVAEGAHVSIADVNEAAVQALASETGAEPVRVDEALSVPCDVFAPCAMGAVVSRETIGLFKCRAIAGAANNQLEHPSLGKELADAGVVYAPDYVINAGGLINVADELKGYDSERAHRKAANIEHTLREVFRIAEQDRVTPAEAADRLAEGRIAAAR